DARWVSRALRREFPDLLAETDELEVSGDAAAGVGASSHDYLEKIFQIPYWVRPIDPDSATSYVGSLVKADVRQEASVSVRGEAALPTHDSSSSAAALARTVTSGQPDETIRRHNENWEATSLELTQWEADALQRFAPLVGVTPRRLIRFVNVYRLIKTSLP